MSRASQKVILNIKQTCQTIESLFPDLYGNDDVDVDQAEQLYNHQSNTIKLDSNSSSNFSVSRNNSSDLTDFILTLITNCNE